MVVGLKPTSRVAVNVSDNHCRWDGLSAPHYEVWFLTLNHRASQRGFWFRYTLQSPLPSLQNALPVAGVWAAVFNRQSAGENLGLRQDFPVDQFLFEGKEEFRLTIGDCLLTSCRSAGRIDADGHTVHWDLSYDPCHTTYHHVPKTLARLARPSSSICSPNLDTRFTGVIGVDGAELMLEDEPGCQSHLWGRKRVDEWVWVHSNAFEKHSESVFEGLAARSRRAGHTLPPLQSLYLRHRGEEHRFIRLRLAQQWQYRLGMGYWSFSAMNTRVYIEGAAQCRLRDMLQAAYTDPDGEKLYCVNSEVANLRIRLFRRVRGVRWRHVETIKSYAGAHLEHASRVCDPDVPVVF